MRCTFRFNTDRLSASHAPFFHTAHPAQAMSSVDADDDSPLKDFIPDNDAKKDSDLSFLDVSHVRG